MPKKKDPGLEPVTKNDLGVLRSDLGVLRSDLGILRGDLIAAEKGLRADLVAVENRLDQKINTLDQKVNNVALRVIKVERDIQEVKENMMTKEDKNEITNRFDQVMGELISINRSVLIRGDWKDEHDKKLANHEERIEKLEVTASA